jgi:hypothetical protein
MDPRLFIWRTGSVRKEVIVVLFAWFCTYVLFDVVSTFWLINYTVVGLAGELNPFGRLVFGRGVWEAYLGKLIGFIPVATITILVDTNYGRIRWVKEVVETVLLVLILISLVAALGNYTSILYAIIERH